MNPEHPLPPAACPAGVTGPGLARRPPGRPRSEQVELAIVETTLDLLVEHGIDGLSIEAVAAGAGVAKTTVYRRWASKQDLVLDAISRLKGPISRPPGRSLREDLVFLLGAVRTTEGDHRSALLMPALIAEARRHPELAEEYWRRIVLPRREVILGVLRRAVDAGLVRPDVDLALVVDLLVSPVLVRRVIRLAPAHETGPGAGAPDPAGGPVTAPTICPVDDQLGELVDIVLRGLAPVSPVAVPARLAR